MIVALFQHKDGNITYRQVADHPVDVESIEIDGKLFLPADQFGELVEGGSFIDLPAFLGALSGALVGGAIVYALGWLA